MRLRLLLPVLLVALGLGACGSHSHTARKTTATPIVPPAGSASADVSTPALLLRWIAAHPRNAGLVILPDRGRPTVSLNPGGKFPLASVRKVLIAGAAVADGALRGSVPRAAVQHFYAPGTDGGAHPAAHLNAPGLSLHTVAQAAIEYSDNAAADEILSRVGADRVDSWSRQQGMASEDPIYPLLGEYAAWTRDPRWPQRSPQQRARRARSLARTAPATRVHSPALAAQLRLARAGVAGTPMEWARLMRRIGTSGAPELRQLLDWPSRKFPKIYRDFSSVLAKGGTQPGTLTEADYLKRKGRPGTAMILFLRDLPIDVEQSIYTHLSNQVLLQALALDPKVAARTEQLLRP